MLVQYQQLSILRSYERIKHLVASEPAHAPDWHLAFRVFGIGRLCNSFPSGTVSGTIRAYAECGAGHHHVGARATVAQTQFEYHSITDRFLDIPLFKLCHVDPLRAGCCLGSRQCNNPVGSWSSSWERYTGNNYQGRPIFSGTAILPFDGTHSLGSSSCGSFVIESIVTQRQAFVCDHRDC